MALSVLIYSFCSTIIELLQDDFPGLAFVFLIPVYWFLFAQNAKRCHDRGNSGWYQLIPFYGLWMTFGDGDTYVNKYGPDPKGRGVHS